MEQKKERRGFFKYLFSLTAFAAASVFSSNFGKHGGFKIGKRRVSFGDSKAYGEMISVIKVYFDKNGYATRVTDLSDNKLEIKDMGTPDPKDDKPMEGCSITNGNRLNPKRYNPVTRQFEKVNLDAEHSAPIIEKDKPFMFAEVTADGVVVLGRRISDNTILYEVVGARLGSNSDPCCWMKDYAGNWKCYPCA